jgi:multiple sugar transport system permease protein/raffinose/stachyose/melibiose transport system permease protein
MSKRRLFDVLIALLLVLWIAPTIWLGVTSLKSEKNVVTDHLSLFSSTPTLANYSKAFGSTEIARWLFNSVIVSVVSTILTLVIDSMIAYALARIPFRGSDALFIFVLAGMMVPFEALIIQLYLEFNALGLINTLAAIVLPRLAMPIGVFILTQFFKEIPLALEEAAYIDGAGRWTIFTSIVIPNGKSALVTVMILSFINAWNDFLWPLVVASDSVKYTITVGIANFQGTHGTEYSLIMAGAVVASLPLIVLFLAFRDQIVKGIALTGMKD